MGSHSADLANLGGSQTSSLVSPPKSAKNYESNTASPRILEEESQAKSENHATLESKKLDSSFSPSSRAFEKSVAIHNSAPAESINQSRGTRNLESVQGVWGFKGDKGERFAISPPVPLEKDLSQTKLESSESEKKVESSQSSSRAFEKSVAIHKKVSNPKVDCHADKSARNDSILDSSAFVCNDSLLDSNEVPSPSSRASEASVAIHNKKVDSMDCHEKSSDFSRNDRKTKNLNKPAKDSKICGEKTSEAVQGEAQAGFFSKSGLYKHSQGRALGVRNRPECEAIKALSRKAKSTKKPAPQANQAVGGRIFLKKHRLAASGIPCFDEKAGLRRLLCGDKTSGLSHKQKVSSLLYRKKPAPYTIAIIGLGYVGLPLALAFGTTYPTIGFDIDTARVKELQEKLDSSGECEPKDFSQAPLVRFSSDPSDLTQANIYLVAVPTPITQDKLPDLSYLQSACELIGSMLKIGDIVVFESTTYPTCTRTFCAPLLESTSKLQLNRDFFVGYSPERINPADKAHSLSQVVKLTSGSTKEAAAIIDSLYASVIPAGTHCVSSIEIAEASKALENAQRDINIAFMNEAYMLFDTLGLDMAEIMQAARTKWNFLPFYPGLVGGHCISVDPYYLSYIAELKGFSPTLLTKARIVNETMPHFIAKKFAKQLESAGISLQGARVLVVGLAFKKDCKDMRNTLVPYLCYELEALGLAVEVLDSLVNKARAKAEHKLKVLESSELVARDKSNANGYDSGYDGVLCNILHTCDAHIDLASLCKPCAVLAFVSP